MFRLIQDCAEIVWNCCLDIVGIIGIYCNLKVNLKANSTSLNSGEFANFLATYIESLSSVIVMALNILEPCYMH